MTCVQSMSIAVAVCAEGTQKTNPKTLKPYPRKTNSKPYLLYLTRVSSGRCIQVLLSSALIMLGSMLPHKRPDSQQITQHLLLHAAHVLQPLPPGHIVRVPSKQGIVPRP